MALRVDGSLWTWGKLSTYYPQPPLDALRPMLQPTPSTAALGTTWTSIAAGGTVLGAVRSDATLWLWGSADQGQLGTGTDFGFSTSPQQVTTPSTAAPAAGWAQVALSLPVTLALRTDGTLWSWGQGENGILGDGNSTRHTRSLPGLVPTPLTASPGSTWTALAVGTTHAAALRSDGSLWAWGYNQDSRLGTGSPLGGSVPTRVVTPAGAAAGTSWTAVAAGEAHTLALRSDGTLWAWGPNSAGQLGIGPLSDQAFPTLVPTPASAALGTSWTQIAAGQSHSLALRSDGTLWTWGANAEGQLGDNTISGRRSPMQEFTRSRWTRIAGGENFSLAIRNGRVYATGGLQFAFNYGQLGDGTQNGSAYFRPSLALPLPTRSPAAALELTLFPNPAHSAVQVSGIPLGTPLHLTNALGQLCRQTTLAAAGLSLTGLSPGLYILSTHPVEGAGQWARLFID